MFGQRWARPAIGGAIVALGLFVATVFTVGTDGCDLGWLCRDYAPVAVIVACLVLLVVALAAGFESDDRGGPTIIRRLAMAAFTGLFVAAWLISADGATGACDDACGGGPNWWENPDSPQWDEQMDIARLGAIACAASFVAWLLRWRHASLVLGAVMLVLLVKWYPIADRARFGPPF